MHTAEPLVAVLCSSFKDATKKLEKYKSPDID
jgi:hypothetical protein